MRRVLFSIALIVAVTACHGPNANVIAPSTPVTSTPTAVHVVPNPAQLPIGGGTAIVTVEVIGTVGAVRDARVHLTASTGTLGANDVTTDVTGHAKVEWQGLQTALITATLGEIVTTVSVRVEERQTAPAPSPGPTPPTPTPAPSPTPPVPTPTPPTPGPALPSLIAAIHFSTTTPGITDPVTMSVTATLDTGDPSPPLTEWQWDFDADGSVDSTIASPTHTFASGAHTVTVRVLSADGRAGFASAVLNVTPPAPPALTLTAGTPIVIGVVQTYTATLTGLPAGETLTAYQWDFEAGTADDATTIIPTRNFAYSTPGIKTAKVTVTTSTGRTLAATKQIVVTN